MTLAAAAAYKGVMKRLLAAVLLASALVTAGCAGSHGRTAQGVPSGHHLLVAHHTLHSLPQRGGPAASCDSRCIWARQGRLDSLAGYATRVAGAVHVFAGVSIDDQANRVILNLVHAPQSVIDQIEKGHPDTYVIHNDAPRTYHEVRALQDSLDWKAWGAKGIHIVSTAPTQTGYLKVGVLSSIPKAQALFDAAYPNGVVRVVRGELAMPTAATGPTH